MAFNYNPEKLLKVENEIIKLHKTKSEENKDSYSDADLYSLILTITSWKPETVSANVLSLTLGEVKKVIKYIPSNKYDVVLDNLFEVYARRETEKLADLLFNEWQDSYANEQCNLHMKELFVFDEEMKKCVSKLQLSNQEIECIFSAISIPIEIGKMLIKRYDSYVSIYEMISKFGLNPKNRLAIDIVDMFYMYCGKEAYLNVSSSVLINAISRYKIELLRLFLINFLDKLNLNQLEQYFELLTYLRKTIGDINSESFKVFFENVDSETKDKYLRWIGRKTLVEEFGEKDDRTLFWKQFVFDSPLPLRFPKSKAIVFRAKDVCFIEFIGEELGPIYWFDTEYFDNEIRSFCSTETCMGLRSEILKPIAIKVRKANNAYNPQSSWKENWSYDEWAEGAPGMFGRQNHTTYYQDKTWIRDMRYILMNKYGIQKESR